MFPSAFPFSCKQRSTHKSGYYRLGGVRQKQPLSAAFFFFFFLRTISYFAFFPPFSFLVQRAQRQKNGGEKTEGENDNEKRGMRESEREREYMVGDSRGMRGLSQRQIPKINSITLIGNTLAKRVHDA